MRRAALAWMFVQACTTYDGISPTDTGGEGGAAAVAGAGPHAGSAGSEMGGNAGSAMGGSGGTTAGSAGTSVEGGAPHQVDGMAGMGDVAGATTTMGGVGLGGAGAEAGAAGEASSAGAGGSPAECLGAAPDVGCTCELYAAHEYWFCSQYLTFAAAENKCKSAQKHLPKIETQAEDDWLFAAAQTHLLGEYFLGATDATTPDEWSWLVGGKFWSGVADGTASAYAHWSANEPNASGDCLVVQGNGPWDDRTCTDQRRYVCESQ